MDYMTFVPEILRGGMNRVNAYLPHHTSASPTEPPNCASSISCRNVSKPRQQSFSPTAARFRSCARPRKKCRGCDLWKKGTQTVFGEGAAHAEVLFVTEQPGDKEDLTGKPFVGPAGAVLDKALVAAGIDRRRVYVTNAVKHFNWEPRGKRRIHKKPNAMQIAACRPWLDAEVAAVKARVIVCLGATAGQLATGNWELPTASTLL